jgi:hypothetical protein
VTAPKAKAKDKSTQAVAPAEEPSKRGRGRPKGTCKAFELPQTKEFTVTDMVNANPKIKCRATIMNAIKRMVVAGTLIATGNVRKFEGKTGRPAPLYRNPNFQANLKELAKADPVAVTAETPEPEPEPKSEMATNS